MSRLGQNLFLRELERRDLDRARQYRDKERQAIEQQRATEAGTQALESVESARDRAMERKFKQAQIEGMQASALGETQPQYKEPVISEMGRLGFRAGEVEKKERSEAEAAKRAFAELTQKGKMVESEYEASQRKALEELKGKQTLEKETSLQKSLRESIEKESSRERALRRELAAMRGTGGPGTRMVQEQTRNLQGADEALKRLTAIEEISRDPKTGKVDYAPMLGTAEQALVADYGTAQRTGIPIDPEAEARLKRQSAFDAEIDFYKSEEYHRLLGAAQTKIEMENLARAIANRTQSPTQFVEAMNAMRNRARRSMIAAKDIMAQGYDPGTAEYEAAMAERVKQGPTGEVASEEQEAKAYREKATIERNAIVKKIAALTGLETSMAESLIKEVVTGKRSPESIGLTREEAVRYAELTGLELSTGEHLLGLGSAGTAKLLSMPERFLKMIIPGAQLVK